MSKPKTCYRCRMPAPEPEHLYQRADGKRLCLSCIVILSYDAEVIEANRHLDEALGRHARHVSPATDCPLCAYGVV